MATFSLEERALADVSSPERHAAHAVVVVPSLCESDEFSLASFIDSLRVELAASDFSCCAVPTQSASDRDSLQLTLDFVACASDGERVLLAVRPAQGPAVEREVSLLDVAHAARPRALALAAAELIRSVERQTPERPVPPVRDQPSVPSVPLAEPASPLVLSLRAEGEARLFPAHDTTLWGGRVRLTAQRRSLHAEFDLGASYSQKHTELGELSLHGASAGLGLGPRFSAGDATLDLGVHAELGWARISGTSEFPDVHTTAGSNLFATVGLRGSLEAPTRARVRPGVTLEVGGVLRSFSGEVNGESTMGITGYYLLAAVGAAVTL